MKEPEWQKQFDERKLREAHKAVRHKAPADVISMLKHAATAQETMPPTEEHVNHDVEKLAAKQVIGELKPLLIQVNEVLAT